MTTTNTRSSPLVGVLECGLFSDTIQARHGDYLAMYRRLLGDKGLRYRMWSVVNNDIPDSVHRADAWVISGSRHGAYDDLPWIEPLKAFLRDAQQVEKPVVAVCFGHQILAEALGGHVELFKGGWGIGRHSYQMQGLFGDATLSLHAVHRDQVVVPPPDATVIGQSDFCPYAALAYGDWAVSIQPHPEFSDDFMHQLLDERVSVFPADVHAAARASIGAPIDATEVGRTLRHFVLDRVT